MSSLASSSMSATFGCDLVSIRTTSWNWARTCSVSGCAKIVRMIDATIGPAVFGHVREHVAHEVHPASLPGGARNTVSIAAISPV